MKRYLKIMRIVAVALVLLGFNTIYHALRVGDHFDAILSAGFVGYWLWFFFIESKREEVDSGEQNKPE